MITTLGYILLASLKTDILRDIGLLVGVWLVAKVSKGSTLIIWQGNGERAATNFMAKDIKEKNGKVMRHTKEDHGQTWDVVTPDGEKSTYTTMDTNRLDEDI